MLYIISISTYTAVRAGLVFKGEDRPKSTAGVGYCSNHLEALLGLQPWSSIFQFRRT